ncbi:hypothetical protein [Cellulomonas oligotrophica]|uniref:Uncharacterized protein n=1 Tax=Cellulomonas oligotrophica TaxID=931536 RepID=A0A7Y9FI22_9CELL|nr:hypothetical protein [Cellulomonas oligotrophica]NYD87731.1 hypothetical protein [Cellulomonas oligotrophica]GIG33064.1 hypothetical protein Col01nite_22230 [Cellulomonas oligotrophica]
MDVRDRNRATLLAAGVVAVAAAWSAFVRAAAGAALHPAVGWATSVDVRLDDAWPDREGLTVDVEWPAGSGASVTPGHAPGPRWQGVAAALPGGGVTVVVRRGGTVVHRVPLVLRPHAAETAAGRAVVGPMRARATVAVPAGLVPA